MKGRANDDSVGISSSVLTSTLAAAVRGFTMAKCGRNSSSMSYSNIESIQKLHKVIVSIHGAYTEYTIIQRMYKEHTQGICNI